MYIYIHFHKIYDHHTWHGAALEEKVQIANA